MRALRLGAAGVLLAAAALSFTKAYAAWRAAKLDPGNASYAAAGGDYDLAVKLNPRDAHSWVQLGLQAEAAGKLQTAEHHLLRAAEVSARWTPRWTLANFYLRRGDRERFWRWASRAANIARYDVAPVIELAYQVEPDGAVALQRLALRDRHALAAFLAAACARREANGIEAAALQLAPRGASVDRALLHDATELLLEARRPAAALRVWNASGERPATRGTVTNPRLEPGTGRGFDWRITRAAGITFRPATPGADAEIEVSGRQSYTGRVLEQWIAPAPGRTFEVAAEHGESDAAGFTWRLDAERGRIELIHAPPAGTRPRGVLRIRRVTLRPTP